MVDRGLTHVALSVSHLNDSIAFYTQYTRMQVVHRRTVPTTGCEVAWLSDQTRPFVIVLSEPAYRYGYDVGEHSPDED